MVIDPQFPNTVKSERFGLSSDRSKFWIEELGFGTLYFSPGANVDGADVEGFDWEPCEDGLRFLASNAYGQWALSFVHEVDLANEAFSVQLEATLTTHATRVVLAPVKLDGFAADHVVNHGRKMGGCSIRALQERQSSEIKSTFFLSITRGGRTLQLSHPLDQEELSDFSGQTEGPQVTGLSAETVFDPCRHKTLVSDRVTFSSSDDGHRLIAQWADVQEVLREPRALPSDCGWNTWDYYRWTITEEEVLKNAEFIASDPILSKHIKRIVIDDGWQYCYGEWHANALFPSGMESIATSLRKMGFTPGLWFAPTIIEPQSRIAQNHPEMLAMGHSGLPCLSYQCMARNGFILDPTREKSEKWLEDLFARYKSYGYGYFKLDFLASTLSAPHFFDRSVPHGMIMRKIVDPIRRGVGDDSKILACNYNFEGGTDLVDDVRISSDIHPKWESVKTNVASIATRYWCNRRFWINDPDFAVCRGNETSDDPDLHRMKPLLVHVRPDDREAQPSYFLDSLVDLNEAEAKVLLSLVISSGGAINLSDNLTRLNAKGLSLVRKVLSAERGDAAVPVDLFHAELPALWIQKLPSKKHRVLLINWSDGAREERINLTALNLPTTNVMDFWTGESLRVTLGMVAVNLPPHACLFVEV
jgi:hypothetical protein